MTRTAEQREADDDLTRAVERVIGLYDNDGEHWVTTDYMVIAAQRRYDDDGDPLTAVAIAYRDGDVPIHHALGLVEYARARLVKIATGATGSTFG